jgi:mono/diheme cytochrome c family protein
MVRSILVLLAFLAGCVDLDARSPNEPMPDPADGRALAEKWCSECHRVSPEQGPTIGSGAPSFMNVVATREETFLRQFMSEQHLPMPTFRLLDEQRADVLAYFERLRSTN